MDREQKQILENKKYSVTYAISLAITGEIRQASPETTHKQAHDLFLEWCIEEDGALAITRLVDLIIH